ncbi:MAG: glycosyltransferase family 2 protein [Caldiserica bacterium]|nr:MAG: glycosyltransferase family 2 protein [Caldisericota bacterium]
MVSVIITTYNRKNFLKEAIESVLNQTYKEIEIIVVDDGSIDGTEEIVKKYPVKYFWQKNRGISSARNVGFKLSKGEYIAYLDSDDLWKKEKLEKEVNFLKENPQYPLCYTDEVWYRNGEFLNQKKKHKKYDGFIFEKCLPLCIISPSSALFRRWVLEKYKFDEKLPVCEDYDLWLRITKDYPVGFIPEKLIIKRGGHPDQLSKKYPAMDRFRIYALKKLLKDRNLDKEKRKLVVEELKRKSKIVFKGALKRYNISRFLKYFYFYNFIK